MSSSHSTPTHHDGLIKAIRISIVSTLVLIGIIVFFMGDLAGATPRDAGIRAELYLELSGAVGHFLLSVVLFLVGLAAIQMKGSFLTRTVGWLSYIAGLIVLGKGAWVTYRALTELLPML